MRPGIAMRLEAINDQSEAFRSINQSLPLVELVGPSGITRRSYFAFRAGGGLTLSPYTPPTIARSKSVNCRHRPAFGGDYRSLAVRPDYHHRASFDEST